MIKDKFYEKACREAKEDFFMCSIQRTDKEVEQRANSYRKKVPTECYEIYGQDLDGCSTQENEGCGRCHLYK